MRQTQAAAAEPGSASHTGVEPLAGPVDAKRAAPYRGGSAAGGRGSLILARISSA